MKCLIKDQVEIVRVVIVGADSHSLKGHFFQKLVCLFFCVHAESFSHYKDIQRTGWTYSHTDSVFSKSG